MSKKVLFIAYHFPPIGGSGVQRSLKYVKYLPDLGYEPLVTTVEKGHNFAYDYSLLNEIPREVKVYRSNSGEKLWLREWIEKATSISRSIKNCLVKKSNINKLEHEVTVTKVSSKQNGLKDKVFRYLEYNYYIPDTKIRWYKHAINDIKTRILKENNIDVIYSTSSPYTDHLIALEIKKKTNKPWVADFRDPWVGNAFIGSEYSEERRKKEAAMESEIVSFADKVIMVTEPLTEMYKKRYPEFEHKFETIPNGFDEEDNLNQAIDCEKFIINYSGILTEGQDPTTLIKAIEIATKNIPGFKYDFVLSFTGLVIPEYKEMLESSSISKYIKISSYVPHDEIIKEMSLASINYMTLVNREESRGVFTGKIFDYILAQRPILGIMPSDGVASNLINHNNIGLSVDHGEVQSVYEFINEIYGKWKNKQNLNTNSIVKCSDYSRKNLAKRLSEIFDEFVK